MEVEGRHPKGRPQNGMIPPDSGQSCVYERRHHVPRVAGIRPRQCLHAAQFDDDDGRIEGEEGEGRGDKRPMDGDGTRSRRDGR